LVKIVKPQSTPFPQKLRQEKKTFISKSTTTWTKEFSHADFTIPQIQVMQLLRVLTKVDLIFHSFPNPRKQKLK
jgi:hypothetical protein